MAKIQNPQNQYGKNLATTEYLESVKGELIKNIDLVSIDVSGSLNGLSNDLDDIKDYVDNKVDTEQIRAEEVENEIKDAIAINAEATVINAEAIANETDRAVATEASLKEETISEEVSAWDITTSFSDGATNVSDFTCDSPISGFLSQVRIYCSPKNATSTAAWLEIRQNDNIIARSTNSQTHGKGNLLEFNFNKILINAGDRYGFYIVNEDGTTPDNSCLALKKKAEVPEVADLNVEVSNWAEYTPRFGFSYYKSNKKILASHINDTVLHVTQSDKDKWNSYNVDNLYSKKGVATVQDKLLTYADGTTEAIEPELYISAQYTFRDNYSTPVAGDSADDSEIKAEDYVADSTLTSFNYREPRPDAELMLGETSIKDYMYEHDFDFRVLFPNDTTADDEALDSLYTLINGNGMFVRTRLTTFNDDLSCLTVGDRMFMRCTLLESFRSAVPSLTCARAMFHRCVSLQEFKSKLPSLAWARMMFCGCTGLTKVDTCLPNLVNGDNMFNNCTSLETFFTPSTSLSNLYYAPYMFNNCPITKFNGNLESLEYAYRMFNGCKLDITSLNRIADTIRDWSDDSTTHILGDIGFGGEVLISDATEVAKSLKRKNWSFTLFTIIDGNRLDISSDSITLD